MPFPVGWPPRPASGRRSVRVFIAGTCTGGFQDSAYLFSDLIGANTYTQTPVVPPGAEKLQVAHGDLTRGGNPGGGRQVGADAADPRYSGIPEAPKSMLFVQTLKVLAPGGDIEFSFDGVNVHGRITSTDPEHTYRNRFEAGIAFRFVGLAAVGDLTTVAGASLVDGDNFILDDGVNSAVTFEFDDNTSVTESNVLRALVFDGTETADQIRDLIITAINNAPVLDITASNGGAATVDLVNDRNGTVGNVAITESVGAVGFVATGMAAGTGTNTTFQLEGW